MVKDECGSISTLTELEAAKATTPSAGSNDNNNSSTSLQESNTSFFKTIFNCANTILGIYANAMHPFVLM